jgi:hypothetical protein
MFVLVICWIIGKNPIYKVVILLKSFCTKQVTQVEDEDVKNQLNEIPENVTLNSSIFCIDLLIRLETEKKATSAKDEFVGISFCPKGLLTTKPSAPEKDIPIQIQ